MIVTRKTKSDGEGNGGFCYDPEEAVKYLASVDDTLARLLNYVGPFAMEIRHLHNPFEALARNIVFQQLHGAAAAAIHGRVIKLFGKNKLHPQDILGATDEELRGAGLSGAKTVALKDLAAKTLDGTVPTLARLKQMSDEEIIERLTQVRGIGRWTVEMLLMFRLGRPDVLPVGDYAVRKGFALIYGLDESPKPKSLTEYGECWRPYRSIASWYMWRATELPPEIVASLRQRV